MNKLSLFTLLFTLFIFSSCKVKFTQAYREKIEGQNIKLKKVQFYNNKLITLKREVDSTSTKTKKGVLKMENGKKIEYIYIKPRTRGICVDETLDKIVNIAFDVKDSYLTFQADMNGKYYHIINENGRVTYGDKVKYGNYEYILPKGEDSKLLFKKSFKLKQDKDRHLAKGLKVEE